MGQKHRLNRRYIQRQMQALGDTCTVVEVARSFSADAYRDETETYTTHTGVYCFVNILTEQDTSVQEGEARAGDLVFNFDYSAETFLKQMNRIIFDSRTFQISDVRRYDAIGNTTYLIECLTKKFSDGTAWTSTKTEGIKVNDTDTPLENYTKTLTDNSILIDTIDTVHTTP